MTCQGRSSAMSTTCDLFAHAFETATVTGLHSSRGLAKCVAAICITLAERIGVWLCKTLGSVLNQVRLHPQMAFLAQVEHLLFA